MDKINALLISKADEFGICLSEKQIDDFSRYYDLLKDYNSHTNVISNDAIEEVYVKHFVDSLAFALVRPEKQDFKMLDIGAGGGFPGVPILLAYEKASLCSVDSVGKKVKLLSLLRESLNLGQRFTSLKARAESLPSDMRGTFDYALARAVAPLNMLVEYCVPYLKIGGIFVAYKAKTAEEEIAKSQNALKLLGAKVIDVKDYKISDEYERKLVLIQKKEKTNPKYPRQNGFVKKYPL